MALFDDQLNYLRAKCLTAEALADEKRVEGELNRKNILNSMALEGVFASFNRLVNARKAKIKRSKISARVGLVRHLSSKIEDLTKG